VKSLILSILCTAFFVLPGFCQSETKPDFYVHAFGGPNYLNIKQQDDVKIKALPGYLVGVGLGLKFQSTRAEIEGSFRYNDYQEDVPIGQNVFFDRGKTEKIAFFFNFYYDFPNDLLIAYMKPYIGAGFGHKVDTEKVKIIFFDWGNVIIEDRYTYKSYGMTLQFITGLSLPMSEHTVTRMEYRYLKDDDYTSNHSFVLNLDRLF